MKHMVSIIALLISFALPVFAQNEIGVTPYPNAVEMTEETRRVLEMKGSSWIAARAYRTDDSIKDVVKHFQKQAEKGPKPATVNGILKRFFEDNWKISDSTVRAANELFGADWKTAPEKDAKSSFGTILLDESLVRVHIMSPYPTSPNTVAKGTMIILVREKLPYSTVSSVSDDEKAYTGRQVTRKVRLLSKPAPRYVGI